MSAVDDINLTNRFISTLQDKCNESQRPSNEAFISSFLNEYIEVSKHEYKCLSSIFEMFLVFIYHGKKFADYVGFLRVEAKKFVQQEIKASKTTIWYSNLSIDDVRNYKKRISTRVFRFLFDMVSGLYTVLKDVRLLRISELISKYPFISTSVTQPLRDLRSITSLVEADDVFHVGLSRVAGSSVRMYSPEIMIPVLKQPQVMDSFKKIDYKEGFQKISVSLRNRTISKAVQHQIKWAFTEYISQNNPFLPTDQIEKSDIRVILPDIPVILPDQEQKFSILNTFTKVLQRKAISLQDLMTKKFLTLPKVDFCSTEYLLISPDSKFELYRPTVSAQNCSADMLSILLHAVRLLYLQGTLKDTGVYHFPTQYLLQKMFANKCLDIESTVRSLHMAEVFDMGAFDFAISTGAFIDNHKSNQFIQLGSLDVTSLTSEHHFRSSIGKLFCQLPRHNSNIFFLQLQPFTQTVKSVSSLPRIVYYKYNSVLNVIEDNILGEIDSDSTISLGLLCFGCVYYSKKLSKYKFEFVSFSPNLSSGKYFLVSYCNGLVENMQEFDHPRYESRNKDKSLLDMLQKSTSVPLQIGDSYYLTGLIMLRREQDQLSFPFFENIWILPALKFINYGDPIKVETKSLMELSASGRSSWLSTNTIDAFLVLLTFHFEQLRPITADTSTRQVTNIILDGHLFESLKISHDDPHYPYFKYHKSQRVNIKVAVSRLADIPENSLIHFPLNTDSNHWRYACIHLRSKRVYIMNSYVVNEDWVVNSLLALCQGLYGETWSCVSLKCPKQNDSVNCGIFAVMNIAYVVQAVEQFDNMDVLTNASINNSWGKINLPIGKIRTQLAGCFVNRQLDITELLTHIAYL
jgi:hypothetical protein